MDLNITWSDVPWTAYRSHYKETHSDLAIPGWVVAHEGECRFRDCRHDHKPGCAINQAQCSVLASPGRLLWTWKARPSPQTGIGSAFLMERFYALATNRFMVN